MRGLNVLLVFLTFQQVRGRRREVKLSFWLSKTDRCVYLKLVVGPRYDVTCVGYLSIT